MNQIFRLQNFRVRVVVVTLLLIGGSIAQVALGCTFQDTTSERQSDQTASADTSRSYVVPIPRGLFQPKPANESSRVLLQSYYDSIEDWGNVVRNELQEVPGNSGQIYIGLKRNVEDDVRPTAYAAMVLSFLSECRPPNGVLSDDDRLERRNEAIGLLRYLTTSHVTGGGACLNGKSWGNQWQSSLWARAVAMAAWQIWPELDANLQRSIVRLVEFESDRFIDKAPKSSVANDTGAEENAWNASMTSLACNMMPQHPHAEDWEIAAKKYMYNTFSVNADAADESLGDDGIPISEWVTTVNAHDDFTVENHRLVHVGYLKISLTLIQENIIHWVMFGKTPPQASHHHVPEVFEVLVSCMNWNGSPFYFGGNDWRIYESQCTDIIMYCMLHLNSQNPEAGYLERTAIKHLRKRQIAEGGFYNARRDLEYSGLCGTRLITCFFAHAAIQNQPEAIAQGKFDERAAGVNYLASARAVLHRTPTKFASFTWAQKRMALAIPGSDSSVVWPHMASYLGLINGKDSSSKNAKLQNFKIKTGENDFVVSGTLDRNQGTLSQDFFYASPAQDFTVYVERLRPQAGFKWKSRESGVIGLEYGFENSRTLRGAFGYVTTRGKGGDKSVELLKARYLNIDDKIGFVVCRNDGQTNVMRYHNNNVIAGRKPHLQEWISLVGEDRVEFGGGPQWACIVTFLNQTAQETKSQAEEVQFSLDGETATCKVGEQLFKIDFSRMKGGQ